jgi:hypothetical protein
MSARFLSKDECGRQRAALDDTRGRPRTPEYARLHPNLPEKRRATCGVNRSMRAICDR